MKDAKILSMPGTDVSFLMMGIAQDADMNTEGENYSKDSHYQTTLVKISV